jgi:TetR/AcrR family transcriptional regulator, regulator of cefoperazone and chloramphenicol sensitivity
MIKIFFIYIRYFPGEEKKFFPIEMDFPFTQDSDPRGFFWKKSFLTGINDCFIHLIKSNVLIGGVVLEHTFSSTPDRILKAAGEIFGREGFKAATIRRIADAADANIASINYHFGDKEGLYAAVLEHLFQVGFSKFPADMGVEPDAPPEVRLQAFLRNMFHRLLSNESWGGLSGRLIAREFLEPTPAFEPIIEKYIKPHKDILISIIAELIGNNPPQEILLPCALSIIGQCLYYALGAPVIKRIAEHPKPTGQNLDQLAEFVFQFSLGGINRIKENNRLIINI